MYDAVKLYPKAVEYFEQAETLFKETKNDRGLVNTYNSIGRAFKAIGTKHGDQQALKYYQLAESIELNTDSKDLPEFSIRDSFTWLASTLEQHKNIYEGELNTKAKEETDRALR